MQRRFTEWIEYTWKNADDSGFALTKRDKHIGSSLDDFLREERVLEDTRTIVPRDADAVDWQFSRR